MQDPSLFNTQEVLALLKLEQVGTDCYRGQSHFMGSPNVFGGQVVGQSLYAAGIIGPALGAAVAATVGVDGPFLLGSAVFFTGAIAIGLRGVRSRP